MNRVRRGKINCDVKTRLLSDPSTRKGYAAQQPGFDLARELIAARVRAGLTQAEPAERMGVPLPSVVRRESGRSMPSLRSLARCAQATGSRAVVRLEKSAA